MKVIVFAYHNMGIAGLEALKSTGFDIQAVFSHDDDPEENCWFGSVVEWARENSISVYCPEKINAPEWIEKIKSMQPEVIFSFYYRHMLGQDILDIPSSGAYNLHGSLLPAYRGRAPVNWVLVNGEQKTGVTLHHMVKKADAGDIVGQRAVEIDIRDTALTLYGKLVSASRLLLGELLPLIKERRAPRIIQDLSAGSYYGGRKPEDGRIDWRWPALRIYNLVRAVTDPYPGAYGYVPGEEKFLIWWAEPQTSAGDHSPGFIYIEGDHVFVETGQGRLKLLEIETGGKRRKETQITKFFQDKEGVVLT